MKLKPKKKESKSRTSKAVDTHLEEEIQVWANDSFTSVASSVTAPPSQTASFYKKVLGGYGDDDDGGFDISSSDDDSAVGSRSSNAQQQVDHTHRSSSDDDISWTNRSVDSSENGGNSERAVSKKKKSSKKKKFKKKMQKLFGGAIQEGDAECEEQAPPRRGRRLSLFGNHSGHSGPSLTDDSHQQHEASRYNSSTDGEFSIDKSVSDDGCGWSQDGSNDDLGYEEAAPTVTRTKVKRRSSLGGLFSKKEEHHEQHEHEHNKEHKSAGVRGRRASMTGGTMPSADTHHHPHAEDGEHHDKPNRRRRNSLFGSMTNSEHMPKSKHHDHESVDNSLKATSSHAPGSHTSGKRRGRRSSLTGSSYNRNSTKNVAPPAIPKDIHRIVNQERIARGMPPFERSLLLDTLAKSMANEMSVGLPPTPTEFYGNVGRGTTLQTIHSTIMEDRSGISRKNILSERFTEFGMALTQGPDGQLYMVALFKD